MLWYKSWLETRWRFLIGLVLLALSVCGTILYYPEVMKLMPAASSIDASGELGRRIKEGVELSGSFRGYVWSQLFRQNLPQMGTLFAVLLGTGGLLSQTSGGAALFTLSLPASRNRLVAVRAATGLMELLTLVMVPALLVPLVSAAVGERYGFGEAFVHGACLFIASATFFSLAFLLSTVFSDLWRPLMLACLVAVMLAFSEQLVRGLGLPPYGIFDAMTAEQYFRTGGLPWVGLFASVLLSSAMLYGAAVNTGRQDF
jgi:ABC-2 type transport system permease protein